MKKMLSMVLALITLFSCMGVPFASAALEEGSINLEDINLASGAADDLKIEGLSEVFYGDIDELKETDYWTNISLLGMTPEFIYSNRPLIWSTLDVFYTDSEGNRILDEAGNPILKVSKGSVALIFSGVNAYVKKAFYNAYGGLKLYNVENAISLINVLGRTFYRDFTPLNPNNFTKLFGNKNPNAKEFFETVSELSGLGFLMEANWVPKGKAYCEPIVNLLGGGYAGILSEHYKDGVILGARILEGIFSKMCAVGPAQTFFDAVIPLMHSYDYYREPIMALFTHKMQKIEHYGTVEKYKTFSGLLEIIFCDCDPMTNEGCFAKKENYTDIDKYYQELSSVDHFCPLDFPTPRIATAEDEETRLLYLYYYLNLCGVHRNNKAYIENLQSKLDNNTYFTEVERTRIKTIFDGYFLNNIKKTSDELVTPYLTESMPGSSSSSSSSGGGIIERIKNSLMVLLKKIADYFDYIRKLLSGELNYGEGGSPFI